MIQCINGVGGHAASVVSCASGRRSPLRMEKQTEVYKEVREGVSGTKEVFGRHCEVGHEGRQMDPRSLIFAPGSQVACQAQINGP